ncbi:pyridoxamine 5'-phosphate oxidase family protein [Bacillus sp. 2205SS5-2]|uniref:pyridoxamine 5'-phosphate oxidase family protein n=1 Tax=Bacillus sp. 2205SS5-2 TaxID=3109031 RepID=UPI0030070806
MANRSEPKLIPALYDVLQNETFITISSMDRETCAPVFHAISWVYAKDEGTLLMAVDQRSRLVENVMENAAVTVCLLANESTYSISGKVVEVEQLQDVPLKLSLLKLKITEVRDVMFYGSKIVQAPKYDKTYDKDAAARLDRQVMEALKKA